MTDDERMDAGLGLPAGATKAARRSAERAAAAWPYADRRGLADDVQQEVLLALWREWHRFDPSRGVQPLVYLKWRARVLALDAMRLRYSALGLPKDRVRRGLAPPQVLGGLSGRERHDDGDRRAAAVGYAEPFTLPAEIETAWDEERPRRRRLLDWRERIVLAMRCVDGLTMKEIGRSLGISESRVSTHQTAAIRKLAA